MNFVFFITLLFHALFFVVPFVFTWVNSELFELNKMLVVYGFTIIIAALWVSRMIRERRFIWKNHPVVLWLLVFLAGQALSTLMSIHFRTSVLGFYSRLNGGFLSSLSYGVLFLALLNTVSKKQRLRLLLTLAFSGIAAALYALPERLGVSLSCYLMHQEWTVACWKQDVQSRIFGTFGQPNWLAMYLVGVLPIAGYFAWKAEQTARRIWGAAIALMILALLFTQSRSGLLGLGAAGAVWAAVLYQDKWRSAVKRTLRGRWTRWLAGGIVAAVLVAAGVMAGQLIPATETGGEQFDLSQGSDSGSIRLIVWQGALKVWQRYPWFGSGPGTFAYSYYQDRPAAHNLVSEWNNLYNKAHNEFLNYLAETGLVGAGGYVLFLGSVWWYLAKKSPLRLGITPERAIMASLAGLTVTHFFGFSTVTSNVLLFLLPAIAFLEPDPAGTITLKRLRLWQVLALWATGIAAMLLLTQVGRFWQADRLYADGKRLQNALQFPEAETALQQASEQVTDEPVYYEQQADLYSQLALTYSLSGEASAAAQLSEAAIANSDYTLVLNPRHLNFYKTRVRVFFLLAQIDKQYFAEAEKVLKAALELSPTDAQLWYNLAIAQREEGKYNEAVQTFQKTVELKSNYVTARDQLGDLLVQLGRAEEGKEQYRFILEKLSSTDQEVREKLNTLELPQKDTE